MFDISEILKEPAFSLERNRKEKLFSIALGHLTHRHYVGCPEYRKILDLIGFDTERTVQLEEFPFLPVRLFKEYDLISVPRGDIVKIMTSSGTAGHQVSKIYLDRETSANQTRALARIASSFLGSKGLPMLIVDSRGAIRERNEYSARGAGILGFSVLGRDHTYALDENMSLDVDVVDAFLNRHRGGPVLVFGFTFMIWEYLVQAIQSRGLKLDLSKGIMVHGGGWKRMSERSVNNEVFKNTVRDVCGIRTVRNYYGMVEQTGSIFMDCEAGYFHAPSFSDIIIRAPKDFSPMDTGGEGLIQLLSLLPGSYPGHSVLSEDLGELKGVDDCPCGRKGKYFLVHGRIKEAEIRGCSDVYESS
jgi:phenylacetate-coenzyme A ligase PaaK-like adenylate-forming protein